MEVRVLGCVTGKSGMGEAIANPVLSCFISFIVLVKHNRYDFTYVSSNY